MKNEFCINCQFFCILILHFPQEQLETVIKNVQERRLPIIVFSNKCEKLPPCNNTVNPIYDDPMNKEKREREKVKMRELK